MPADFLVFEGGGRSGMTVQDLGAAITAGVTGTSLTGAGNLPKIGKEGPSK